MTKAELIELLNDLESYRAERKESMADKDKIRQAICAFANDLPDHKQPGVLFIGVNDNGCPTGLRITDQLLQDLASMRADGNILPFPSLTVQKQHLKGDKELGYVQRFGIGIALARKEMESNGNPPIEFQIEDSHVAVLLRR